MPDRVFWKDVRIRHLLTHTSGLRIRTLFLQPLMKASKEGKIRDPSRPGAFLSGVCNNVMAEYRRRLWRETPDGSADDYQRTYPSGVGLNVSMPLPNSPAFYSPPNHRLPHKKVADAYAPALDQPLDAVVFGREPRRDHADRLQCRHRVRERIQAGAGSFETAVARTLLTQRCRE